MSVFKLPGTAIQANTITTTQLQTTVVTQIQAGGGPKVKSLIYPGNDSAANSTGGQTVYITGSGFAANAQVLVNGSAVPSQSFISASNISFTTPALSTGTYPVYIINPEDGGTAILYPGLLISGEPSWVTSATLPGVDVTGTWSISLSASGDTPITYALAAGNTLPSGITLSANGLISGTLSSPPGSETTYNFSVIATDVQNQDSTRQFSITASVGDAYFANNVLLIHADGTNNGNNHAFIDSSASPITITRNGNSTQGSYSPFSQTGWSNLFDGVDDNLSVSAGSGSWADFGSGEFTIEAWIFPRTVSTLQGICGTHTGGTNTWQFRLNNATLEIFGGASGGTAYAGGSVAANTWTHVAACRSGTNVYVFVNGILTTRSVGSSDTFPAGTNVTIGNLYSSPSAYWFNGYISNLRVLKGTAQYTSNFTPATSALTAISNTSLLTCQSNRFIDTNTQTTAKTITIAGSPSVQAFSPFAPIAAYSTANNGGTIYFDGASDWLSMADNSAFDLGISQQPFTMEWWMYNPSSVSGWQIVLGRSGGFGGWNGSTGWQYHWYVNNSNALGVGYYNGSSYTYLDYNIGYSIVGRWAHIAISYNGTTLSFYVDGTRIGSTSVTNFTKPSSSIYTSLGSGQASGEASYVNGYISGFRIVKGNAVYDPTVSTLSVPTAPSTAVTNTKFLLSATNANIFDQTAKNVIETVGDAKVSTSVYKYGTGSIAFDGTGDWLVSPVSQNFDFGTGDFTIECWFRLNSLASNYYVIGGNYNAGASDEWLFQVQNNGSIRFLTSADSTFATPSPAITTNTWYHLAATRSGSTVRLFIDGTSIRSYTNANSLGSSSKKVYWGIQANESSWPFNGYIDDIRITKGYARYTSNFTPPTSALKDK